MSQKFAREITIGTNTIGLEHPTYFIADISANHDNDFERAKDLIFIAAEAGADAAKFQHFEANTIVSDVGFKTLGSQVSHQKKWKTSVYEVYEDAVLKVEWTKALKETCDKAGIDFFTSPYSLELVDIVTPNISAIKIGSGDITWLEIIEHIANKNLPVLLATGASNFDEVVMAVDTIINVNKEIVLMQCNTNYTGGLDNFKYINLNVLNTFRQMYPGMILGLSDHTPKHATVLGAITYGARVIEKHFTDDTTREGPDHGFSLDPKNWTEMVERSRELESALGVGIKKVEENEKETVVLQRRSIRLAKDLEKGSIIEKDCLKFLRPCPADALQPYRVGDVLGKKVVKDYQKGQHLKWEDLI